MFGLGSSAIVRDGVWVAAGQTGSVVGALVSIRLLTTLLSPVEFGRLTLLVGVSALALGLAVTPCLQGVMRFYGEWSIKGEVATLRAVAARLIGRLCLAIALVITTIWLIAGPSLGGSRVTGLLIAALFVVDGMRTFEIGLLNSARRQRPTALLYAADAWSRLIMAAAAIILFGRSAQSAMVGYLIGSALVVMGMRAAIELEGREMPRRVGIPHAIYPMNKRALRVEILRYALPIAPLAIFGWISGVGDRYVIGGLLGLAPAGLYAAIYGLVSKPFLMASSIVELTMRPVLYAALAAQDKQSASRAIVSWLMTIFGASILGIAGFLLLSRTVAYIFLSPSFQRVSDLMPWIALGYGVYIVAIFCTNLCYAFNDTSAVLKLTVSGALISITVGSAAVYLYGLEGAAMAVPVYFTVELLLAIFFARRAGARFWAKHAGEGKG